MIPFNPDWNVKSKQLSRNTTTGWLTIGYFLISQRLATSGWQLATGLWQLATSNWLERTSEMIYGLKINQTITPSHDHPTDPSPSLPTLSPMPHAPQPMPYAPCSTPFAPCFPLFRHQHQLPGLSCRNSVNSCHFYPVMIHAG